MERTNKKGFTLSELMAVVVIIAIIAGIALGSYRSITEKAVFNEGLTIAHTIAAAADEYYYEYHVQPASLEKLVLDLKGVTVDGKNISSKHFTGVFAPTSSVRLSSKDYPYDLSVSMEYYGQKPDYCIGRDSQGKGKAFCQSMGYANCSGSNCTKE